MKVSRPLSLAFAIATIAVAVSCSDRGAPTAPLTRQVATGAPEANLIGLVQDLLLTCTPMPEYSARQVIGREGGTMVIGPHTFIVPPGALSDTVTIVATAPSGNVNGIVFQPEGLTFQRPTSLTMSYANCYGLGMLLPKHIAYTTDLLQIIYDLVSVDNILTKKVTGEVNHFSEYVVAW